MKHNCELRIFSRGTTATAWNITILCNLVKCKLSTCSKEKVLLISAANQVRSEVEDEECIFRQKNTVNEHKNRIKIQGNSRNNVQKCARSMISCHKSVKKTEALINNLKKKKNEK